MRRWDSYSGVSLSRTTPSKSKMTAAREVTSRSYPPEKPRPQSRIRHGGAMRRLLISICLIAATPTFFAADDTSPATMQSRIEGSQSPDRQGLDRFTLQQLMEQFHVPGVSVAVIKDFKIDWAKGYG